MLAYEDLTRLESKPLQFINGFFSDPNKYGTLTAFEVGLTDQCYQESLIIVGTSKALLFAFNLISKEVRIFSKGRNLEYEKVDSLCVSQGCEFVVAGYSMGQVTIWDLKTFEEVKNIIGVFLGSVTIIRILNEANYSFVAADTSGMLMHFSITKSFFSSTLQQTCIYAKGPSSCESCQRKSSSWRSECYTSRTARHR